MRESTNPTPVEMASYPLDQLNAIDTWTLQKLVYYCHAWCLGIYKTKFINDTFKDYANGPVNKRLFDTHRGRRVVRREDYQLTHSILSQLIFEDQKGALKYRTSFYVQGT